MLVFSALKKAIMSGLTFRSRMFTSTTPSQTASTYPNSFAMSGCGWLLPFYFGVIDAMKARGVMNNASVYAGTSAGSLASLVAACDIDCKDVMKELSALPADQSFISNKNDGLKRTLKRLLPPDALQRCNGRLHVTMTKVWPNPANSTTIVSHFKSVDHLVDVVAASCFIPLYSATKLAVQVGDHPDRYIDGGVFAFMPPIGEVTISPFPQRFIYDLLPDAVRPAPSTYRPACIYLDRSRYSLRRLLGWVLVPPPAQEMWGLFRGGQEAANRWMDAHPHKQPRT